jgi:hypothetical protein
VKLLRKPFPIHDENFKKVFPTLLSKDMPLLELIVSPDEGELLQSDKPLRVSERVSLNLTFRSVSSFQAVRLPEAITSSWEYSICLSR